MMICVGCYAELFNWKLLYLLFATMFMEVHLVWNEKIRGEEQRWRLKELALQLFENWMEVDAKCIFI